MLFGNRIRELRDKQGVLQRQLAALLEIQCRNLDEGYVQGLGSQRYPLFDGCEFLGHGAVHEIRPALPASEQGTGCRRDFDRRVLSPSGEDGIFSVQVRHPRLP